MHTFKNALIFIVLTLLSVNVLAQADCPAIVQTALTQTNALCANTGRNQVCYGHVAINAASWPGASNFTFSQAGDLADLSAIQNLQLSGMTPDGRWGVALLRIQANLPDTLPGRNVTLLIFGDNEITQAIQPPQAATLIPVTVSGEQPLNLYLSPSTSAAVLRALDPGSAATAIGRLADGSWLQIEIPDGDGASVITGWVAADAITPTGDVNTLDVVDPAAPQYGPMQAFYLRSSLTSGDCAEVPASGMLVQTPQGSREISLEINQVSVHLGSTVFFSAVPGHNMTVRTLEGAARVTAHGQSRPVLPGTEVNVPMDDQMTPQDTPSQPESYQTEDVQNMPVGDLQREIQVSDPMPSDELAIVQQYELLLNSVNPEDVGSVADFLTQNCSDNGGDCTPPSADEVVNYLTSDLGYTPTDLANNQDLTNFLNDQGYDTSQLENNPVETPQATEANGGGADNNGCIYDDSGNLIQGDPSTCGSGAGSTGDNGCVYDANGDLIQGDPNVCSPTGDSSVSGGDSGSSGTDSGSVDSGSTDSSSGGTDSASVDSGSTTGGSTDSSSSGGTTDTSTGGTSA